ncbi:winged helix-turn-helix domain-containing protein [Serratia fonticola]|uniref:winged helix-turn-helix domain-containing protein n=1 Tax=Serratia fonticola TaxID=47917 RepID=UPI003BB56374
MKYIINLNIIFDPDNRILMVKNDIQQSVELSKPATRLLCELINNNRVNLARDDLLKNVWADYGFSPSNASLNNHISELRKAFTNLGVSKDIISTVPRVGFRMDAEIHPIQKSEQEITESAPNAGIPITGKSNTFSETLVPTMTDQGEHQSIYLSLKKHKMIIYILAILLLLTTVTGTTMLRHSQKESVNFVVAHEKCSIYNLNDDKPTKEFTAKILKEIAAEGIDCSREDLDVFYAEAHPNNDRFRVRLLTACSKIDAISYKNCLNYKTVE